EKPTGTFTFKPPAGKKYSLTELVDLINETLSPKFALVRGEKSFTVIPADESADDSLFPRVEVRDLGSYGKTEIVSVILSLGPLNLDDTISQLKAMLSSFGRIHPLGKTAIIICDKTKNVKRIVDDVTNIPVDTAKRK
ncbi:MAG TPA: hypothetical protein VGJ05_04265, partial [Fimbriiglobus sp.]